MGQVEAAEDAVPIGIVALGPIEVAEPFPRLPGRAKARRDHDHALVEAIRLRVLPQEVPEQPAAEEATGLRRGAGLELRERGQIIGLEDPLHHFLV